MILMDGTWSTICDVCVFMFMVVLRRGSNLG